MPAEAGIQLFFENLNSRFDGNDGKNVRKLIFNSLLLLPLLLHLRLQQIAQSPHGLGPGLGLLLIGLQG
jgi:hypothetical protein